MIEVKVKNISERGPGFSRNTEIIIDGIRVETPDRMLITPDLNAKSKVPTVITLNNKVALLTIPLSASLLADILSDEANRHLYRASMMLERRYGDLYGIHALIPYLYPSGKNSADYIKNVKHVKRFTLQILPRLMVTTRDYRFGTVLIPPFKIPLSEYKELLKVASRRFERLGMEIIPVIDIGLKTRDFVSLLNYMIKDLNLKMICLKYRNISLNISKLVYLDEFLTDDIGLMYIDVPRHYDFFVEDFAMPHLIPLLGSDLVAPTLPHYRNKPYLLTFKIDSFRLMNRENLTLPPVAKLSPSMRGKLLNELEVSLDEVALRGPIEYIKENNSLMEDLRELEYLQNIIRVAKDVSIVKQAKEKLAEIKDRLARIFNLSRVQEVKASTKELQVFRRYVKMDEVLEYSENKPSLATILQRLDLKGKIQKHKGQTRLT